MKFLIFLVLCIFGATICASTPINGPETAIVNGINVANNPGFHVHIHVSKYFNNNLIYFLFFY